MYQFLFDIFKKEDLIDFFGDDISYYFDNLRFRENFISVELFDYSMFYISLFPSDFASECVRWSKNLRKRKDRCIKRIKKLVSSCSSDENALFLTFTISDDFIDNSYSTFTRKLKLIHNQNADDFVINSDFGEKNGRLHFHSVIKCKSFDIFSWPYGHVKMLKVFGDSARLATYVSKLSNHALKYSAYKTIYSRKKKFK